MVRVGMNRPIDVVHVGSSSRDLVVADPRGWRLGGGVTYAALTTARLGLRTAALIGVDDASATAHELEFLRDAGVDLVLQHLPEGPIFDNQETPAGRVQICHAVGRPLNIPILPPAWLQATAWSLVPVADEVDQAWADVVPAGAFLAVGWQGMLRDLVPGGRVTRRPPGPSALIRRADLVGVSRHDVAVGTSVALLAGFMRAGADLLVTEGPEGGLLVRVGADGPREILRYRPTASDREIDQTGAGDTFLAAALTSVIRPAIGGRSRSRRVPDLRFAAAAGSLTVEGPGLAAVPDRAAVLVRRARDGMRRDVRPSADTQVGVTRSEGSGTD